jgi:hypothetical protein
MQQLPLPRTIWERLPPGRRALIVDPYDNWPPRAGDGVFISGWQYRNRLMALERWSRPRRAHRAFARQFGAPPLVEDSYGAQPARRLVEICRHLVAAPGRVSALVRDLVRREPFDLVWATFSAGHFAGHFLWDSSQLADADTLTDADRGALARVLEDVYEAIDRAVGEILETCDQDTDMIELSPIGMGSFTSWADALPEMLHAVLEQGRNGHAAGSSMFRLRAAVPSSFRAAVANVLPAAAVHELAARLYLQGVDWARTRAVALPGEHNGYVRLNVRGRERDGIVAPDAMEAVMQQIADGLPTFLDESGAPTVEAVERPHMGNGAGARLLPDLVVRWADRPSTGVGTIRSERFGEIRRHGKVGLSGHHCDGAWAVMRPGRSRLRALARRPRLVDVGASICAVLGGDSAGLAGESFFDHS